jgi:MFS transporter, PPP family, 3-phenylpropionic acid transporter
VKPGPAPRLAFYYAAVFGHIGIQLPFWPIWLDSRGLDAAEIGLFFSAALWVKTISNPLIGGAVDRTGERRRPMILFAALSLAGYALYPFVQGFWQVLTIGMLTGATLSALMPLGESLTMRLAYEKGMDYGRIRLWGSVAFVLGAFGAGSYLEGRDPDTVLWLLLGTLTVLLLACATVPDHRQPKPAGGGFPVLTLLRRPRFALFIAACGMLQASHAVYYGFATLHWRAAGISDVAIGLLWAEGVAVEVALFAASNRAVARFGPVGLMLLAAGAGVLRWSVTAWTVELGPLIAVQALHALTFGAAHLGAMHYIQRTVPGAQSASAQSLYSAIGMGLVVGLAMAVSGLLYEDAGGGAFLAMAALSLAGGVLCLMLRRAGEPQPLS